MSTPQPPATPVATKPPSRLYRMWDSDVFFSFRRSPVTIVAATVAFVLVLAALLAPWIAPYNPFNPASLNLMRSEEHTSELQSREKLVCRLLLEKKKK